MKAAFEASPHNSGRTCFKDNQGQIKLRTKIVRHKIGTLGGVWFHVFLDFGPLFPRLHLYLGAHAFPCPFPPKHSVFHPALELTTILVSNDRWDLSSSSSTCIIEALKGYVVYGWSFNLGVKKCCMSRTFALQKCHWTDGSLSLIRVLSSALAVWTKWVIVSVPAILFWDICRGDWRWTVTLQKRERGQEWCVSWQCSSELTRL